MRDPKVTRVRLVWEADGWMFEGLIKGGYLYAPSPRTWQFSKTPTRNRPWAILVARD